MRRRQGSAALTIARTLRVHRVRALVVVAVVAVAVAGVVPAAAQTNSGPVFPDVDSSGAADPVMRMIAENTTSVVLGAPVTAADADIGDTSAYSVAAPDGTGGAVHLKAFNDDFELDRDTGQISVSADATIDFETHPTYKVTYEVTDGKDSAGNTESIPTIDDTLELTITVKNADDPGIVSFGADPVMGTELIARLTDPDTVSGAPTWRWQRSKRPEPDGDFELISGATTERYTPVSDDHAFFLGATASYGDGDGAGKSAVGVTAHPVGVPRRLLVSNTTNPGPLAASSGVHNTILYKQFGTGDNPAGYQLDRVQVHLSQNYGGPVTAQLYKSVLATGVGSFFVDLVPENPSNNLRSGGGHWMVPPAGTVLEPDTNYFVRLAGAANFEGAIQGSEGPGGASGWRINNDTVTHNPNDSYIEHDIAMRLAVNGVELVGPPGPPSGVSAAPDDLAAVLSWSAPGSTGHRAVTKYQVRHKKTAAANFGAWSDVADSDSDGDLGDERSVTQAGLEGGTEYTWQVRAVNSEGDGTRAETIVVPSSAPSFSDTAFPGGAVTRQLEENTTSDIPWGPITATDDDGDTLTYSVAATTGGTADKTAFDRHFTLNKNSGQISIKPGAMIDHEARDSYTVLYRVTDGEDAGIAEGDNPTIDDTLTLTIEVTDADDAGMVSWRADPQVGTLLTAILSDDDTVSDTTTWQWARSKRPYNDFNNITDGTGNSASYTPGADDRAYFLRATASYTDDYGTGKTATADTSLPVGVSRRELLKNTHRANHGGLESDGLPRIFYKQFGTGDNPAGYWLNRIQVRMSGSILFWPTASLYKRDQPSGVGSFFVDLEPEDPSADLRDYGHHWMVPPAGTLLEPDTIYFIRVERVMYWKPRRHGVGASAGAASGWHTSTVNVLHNANDSFVRIETNPLPFVVEGLELLGPPGSPSSVSVAAGEDQVTLRWSEPGSDGHRGVTKFQVRHKKTADANFGAWADVADSDSDSDMSDERSATVTGLDGGVKYTLQVRAVNSEGDGTGAEVKGAPHSAPSFSDQTVMREVTENTASGTVGDRITTTDADGDTLTYSVAATTGGTADKTAFDRHFTLNKNSGQISVKRGAMIDYETRNSYTVLYGVTDGEDALGAPQSPLSPTTP